MFSDRLALRLKKLDRELLTRNVVTNHQQTLAVQGTLDGIHAPCLVSAGYVLDEAQADIERIVVVRRVRGIREWWIDLREMAAGGGVEPITPILPGTGPTQPLPGIARPGMTATEDEDS